jgi:hypothetical protein
VIDRYNEAKTLADMRSKQRLPNPHPIFLLFFPVFASLRPFWFRQ